MSFVRSSFFLPDGSVIVIITLFVKSKNIKPEKPISWYSF